MNEFQGLNPYTPADLQGFVGRKLELDRLEHHLIKQKKSRVFITGRRGMGKTSLYKVFIGLHQKKYENKVLQLHYSKYGPFSDDAWITRIPESTKLLVIDDFADFNQDFESFFSVVEARLPEIQVIVSCVEHPKKLIKNEDLHINLDGIDLNILDQLLKRISGLQLNDSDKVRLIQFSRGNPAIIQSILYQALYGRKSLDEVIIQMRNEFHHYGLFDAYGERIIESTPEYKQIVSDIRVVNGNILQKVKFNPKMMHSMTGREFEEFSAELLLKLGYEVDLTKATRDGGKDLIIANNSKIGNFIYYVECKKYAPENPVSVNLVRELVGTVTADRVTAGILITSSYFSPDAYAFSQQMQHQVSLVDYMKLVEWLNDINADNKR